MSRRAKLTGMTLAEENAQQVGLTQPGWHCPVCGRQCRSQVFRREHIKKVHPLRFSALYPPPPPKVYVLAESECLEADPTVDMRVLVDKRNMPELPEDANLRVHMDDGRVFEGYIIDSTEGYHDWSVTATGEFV